MKERESVYSYIWSKRGILYKAKKNVKPTIHMLRLAMGGGLSLMSLGLMQKCIIGGRGLWRQAFSTWGLTI